MGIESRILALKNSDSFMRQFDLELKHFEEGKIEVTVKVTESMMRAGGMVNGGVIAGLMDAIGSLCIFTYEDIVNGFTINLSTNFLEPLYDKIATLYARVERSGKKHLFITMYIEDGQNHKIANATGIWSVVRV